MQGRSETTQEKVLDAARDLLNEKGIEAVSLKDIRERSGISNGSIFHHFGSRDGVFLRVFVEERSRYLKATGDAIIHFAGEDPCDAVAEGARGALEFQMRDPWRFTRLILNLIDSDWMMANKDMWVELTERMQVPVTQWAMPHFASGMLPMMPLPFFQSIVFGFPERLTSAHVIGRLPQNPLELADKMVLSIASGLKALRDPAIASGSPASGG